jgi:hypothetical protein
MSETYERMENISESPTMVVQQTQSPVSTLINFLCCVGLIALVVVGSLCIEQADKASNTTSTTSLCGPAGRSGGVAMVAVGGTFLGIQLLIVCCTICLAGSVVTALVASTSSQSNNNTPVNQELND